jgi:hypothetical protein
MIIPAIYLLILTKGGLIMKNTYSKLMLIVLFTFAVLCFANGQKKAIKERVDRLIETGDLIKVEGTVTAFNKCYVKNAEVTARKTRSKVFTDSLGRFEILTHSGDVLVFKAHGFKKNRRKVSAKEDEITVKMILMPGEKNQKIATGFGHMSVKDMAFAYKYSKNINDEYLNYSDMQDLLQKKLLDAEVTNQGGIKVFVRRYNNSSDFSSHNSGAALFVLDGMIVPCIDYLNPQNVASVTLLKDKGGTAIYGPRGLNGVVIIKTIKE